MPLLDIDHVFADSMMSMGRQLLTDVMGSFPGIDEAMSFAEVMRLVKMESIKC